MTKREPIKHPTERARYCQAMFHGPMPRTHPHGDAKLEGAPERPCSRCGKRFQPTLRRRLLCAGCFTGGHDASLG